MTMPLCKASREREEVRQLRESGLSIKELAARYECDRMTMSRICRGCVPGVKRPRENVRMSAAWHAGIRSAREIADKTGVKFETAVKFCERRQFAELFERLESDELAIESKDNGRRIRPAWMRTNCSRFERTVGQCRALCGLNITLKEVYRSAIEAGLTITPAGFIGCPGKTFREGVETNEREPRVYKLSLVLSGKE